MSDLDMLRDIPGYKAILKSVLRMQIQMLLEQLSQHTGEESIIMTASVNDGTLSHLGSNTGKGFLEGRDEIKSQFLGYCLKTHHRQKNHESKTPYQRPHPKYQRPSDVLQSITLKQSPSSSFPANPVTMTTSQNFPTSLPMRTSLESFSEQQQNVYATSSKRGDFSSVTPSFEMTENNEVKQETRNETDLHSKLQETASIAERGSVLLDTGSRSSSDLQGQISSAGSGERTQIDMATEQVKIEPISEQDLELEITGVEIANQSMSSEGWDPTQTEFGSQNSAAFNYDASRSMGMSMTSADDISLVCPVCFKKLSNKQSLCRHMLIHSGDRPFGCSHCDKTFRLRHHMLGHERTVHRIYNGQKIPDELFD